MGSAIVITLTIMCEDPDLLVKATEAISRTQLGLAMEGLHTSLTIATVEYEEIDQEEHQ